MRKRFAPASSPLVGTVHVPGDKSISHRAVLFSAMAGGMTRVFGLLDSADVRSTIGAVEALGASVEVSPDAGGSLCGRIVGWGTAGPSPRVGAIDCGNSGTTARLLMGVLSGWPLRVTLTGDESLSSRPMLRVTTPLTEMGASFRTAEQGTLPVTVRGSSSLTAIEYASPVASAQVKSAVLLAGLRASGPTCVTEPAFSRDHTERMLHDFGVEVEVDAPARRACVTGPALLRAAEELVVPKDPSSAAFLAVAAAVVPGSAVVLPDVALNETRVGFLRVLERMGARIEVTPGKSSCAEPDGTIAVSHSPSLHGTVVSAGEVPSLIDEVPILALAAARAQGVTRFEGVGELRVKESDRLAAVVEGLGALGATARAEGDTLVVTGGSAPFRGAELRSLGDHRLAMTWAVASLVADADVEIDGFEAVDVSYPRFARDLQLLSGAGV